MLARLREKKLLIPGLMVLAALPVLLSLGFWQLDRKAWKDHLVASITERTIRDPIDVLSVYKAHAGVEAADIEYTRVRARGRFHHDKELYYYAPDPKLGPGYHVFTPFEISPAGPVVFVNRGYVPDALRTTSSRAEGQTADEVEVTGLIRMPVQPGQFTPPNEPDKNLWFWRDLDGMYRAAFPKADKKILPLFIDSETIVPGGWPKGGVTDLKLTNRHLEYVLTWFGLAVALLVIFGFYAASRLRTSDT